MANIYGIAYGSAGEAGSKFVAVGDDGAIAYSSDGANWTAVENSPFYNWLYSRGYTINAISFGTINFVAGGLGLMGYSTDGVSWGEERNQTFWDSRIRGITWGNNRFVAVGDFGLTAYSTDNGATWTIVSNNSLGETNNISSIAFGNGKFVAGGQNGNMAYADW
jgi:photosystem II stability/assembly factor-like uncharacterized protein